MNSMLLLLIVYQGRLNTRQLLVPGLLDILLLKSSQRRLRVRQLTVLRLLLNLVLLMFN